MGPVQTKNKMKRVLIVDDDKDMHTVYRHFFEGKENEFEVELTDDPQKAFLRLDQKSFDLLILDIIMEPLSGDSFLLELRQKKNDKPLHVLIVSVLSLDILRCLKDLGDVDFLKKPITKEQLFRKIDGLLPWA